MVRLSPQNDLEDHYDVVVVHGNLLLFFLCCYRTCNNRSRRQTSPEERRMQPRHRVQDKGGNSPLRSPSNNSSFLLSVNWSRVSFNMFKNKRQLQWFVSCLMWPCHDRYSYEPRSTTCPNRKFSMLIKARKWRKKKFWLFVHKARSFTCNYVFKNIRISQHAEHVGPVNTNVTWSAAALSCLFLFFVCVNLIFQKNSYPSKFCFWAFFTDKRHAWFKIRKS